MTTLAQIAQIGLLFSEPPILAGTIILGFLYRHEKIFAHTTFLLGFTMIYNMFLKSLWQLPLPAHMDGWAFPSGHMHIGVVFWGYLAAHYKNTIVSALVVFVLCLTGYALVYEGYHYPVDILGSLVFGAFSVLCYSQLQKLSFFKEKDYRLGWFLVLLSMLVIALMPEVARKPHVWQGLGIVLGFSLGFTCWSKYKELNFSFGHQMMLIVLAIGGIVTIYLLTQQLPLTRQSLLFTQFFMIALWISSSKLVAAKLLKIKG